MFACNWLSTVGFKLDHVSKGALGQQQTATKQSKAVSKG